MGQYGGRLRSDHMPTLDVSQRPSSTATAGQPATAEDTWTSHSTVQRLCGSISQLVTIRVGSVTVGAAVCRMAETGPDRGPQHTGSRGNTKPCSTWGIRSIPSVQSHYCLLEHHRNRTCCIRGKDQRSSNAGAASAPNPCLQHGERCVVEKG